MEKTGVVRVDPNLHRLVKIASVISGKTIGCILREALIDWLEKNQSGIEMERLNAN